MKTKNKLLKRVLNNTRLIAVLCAVIVVTILFAPTVHAQTITIANPGGIMERDVLVYNSNGTLYGLYNTTSVIDLGTGGSDYIFTLKPQAGTPLDDPLGWLTSLIAFAQVNSIALFFIAVLLGIAATRKW